MFSAVLVLSAAGQGGQGATEGWILDPSYSPVAGDGVVLANRVTGHEQRVETDERGRFVFPAVPAGACDLRVSKAGFRDSEIRVLVGQRLSQVIKLELGAISESITVTESEGSLRETTSNQLGTLIEPVSVRQLPVNGRIYLQLGYLSSAAQEAGSNPSNFTAMQTWHADRTIAVAGIQQDMTGYLVNGVSVAGI